MRQNLAAGDILGFFPITDIVNCFFFKSLLCVLLGISEFAVYVDMLVYGHSEGRHSERLKSSLRIVSRYFKIEHNPAVLHSIQGHDKHIPQRPPNVA